MKIFNISGPCTPEKHYMVDTTNKINAIFQMIEQGDYFVINRPRQYGKTTTLYRIDDFIQNSTEYFPISISFEGISQRGFETDEIFIQEFFLLLTKAFKNTGQTDLLNFIKSTPSLHRMFELDLWISDLIEKIGKKTVLMIDEVDRNCNNQLFLDFLGILRKKFLNRYDGPLTFHSVILAGVHDVKNIQLKIKPEAVVQYNSPWNIATDFKIDLSFSAHEIIPMLKEYSGDHKIEMDHSAIAEKIVYYTSGYPYLVSLLCKLIHEELIPLKPTRQWLEEDLDKAFQITLTRSNTNFDSLIKNLENHPDLYDYVFRIIIEGSYFTFNTDIQGIKLGTLYGIFKKNTGKVRIHNRVYEQIFYNYMIANINASVNRMSYITGDYLDNTGNLDIPKIFQKFQMFMKENYSEKDRDFIEKNGRLLFLAFIKPILNGRGFDFKEAQISEEMRLDIVVTFDNRKYIIELKIWRGDSYHQDGIRQLCTYLKSQNQSNGYLLIYDLRKESGQTGKVETIESDGKQIFAAWV